MSIERDHGMSCITNDESFVLHVIWFTLQNKIFNSIYLSIYHLIDYFIYIDRNLIARMLWYEKWNNALWDTFTKDSIFIYLFIHLVNYIDWLVPGEFVTLSFQQFWYVDQTYLNRNHWPSRIFEKLLNQVFPVDIKCNVKRIDNKWMNQWTYEWMNKWRKKKPI